MVVLRRLLFAVLFAVAPTRADDWPQWRGPNRDGVWRESGIVETIPARCPLRTARSLRVARSPRRSRPMAKSWPRGGVQSLAFSSSGNTLATGSSDETVKLWDVATGKEGVTLWGHRSGISAVAFSPDDRTLASAGMDDAVRLWDLSHK